MSRFNTDAKKLDLLTKIASLPPEQLQMVMKGMDREGMLAEFARLPPVELSAMLAKLERHKALQLAKADKLAKKSRPRTWADWGTPLNPR